MAVPGGQGLGNAVGTVTIQANLAQAENQINQFVQNTTNVFNSLNQQTNNVANSFTRMTTVVRGIGAAFGIGFGAHTISQLAHMVVESNELATAYERQMVAAEDLAGGQAKLNVLMDSYADATGHILSESDQLADVTKLMAVGFADSAVEIEKFATAIRGISVAMGATQHSVTQNLILELFSQRGARLDQLGLQYDKVKERVTELMDADRTMTKQVAYQQAVLEQAIQRYGALSESAEGAATGLEKAAKAAKDAELEIGKVLALPVDVAGTAFAMYINNQIGLLKGYQMAWDDLYAAMQRAIGINVPTGMTQRFIESSAGRDAGRHGGGGDPQPTPANPKKSQTPNKSGLTIPEKLRNAPVNNALKALNAMRKRATMPSTNMSVNWWMPPLTLPSKGRALKKIMPKPLPMCRKKPSAAKNGLHATMPKASPGCKRMRHAPLLTAKQT